MSDYISRDVAIIEFMDNDLDHIQAPNGKEAVQILSDIPAADVVPVVRCKDCLFFTTEKSCCRPEGLIKAREDAFCSYGKRREEQKDERIYRT